MVLQFTNATVIREEMHLPHSVIENANKLYGKTTLQERLAPMVCYSDLSCDDKVLSCADHMLPCDGPISEMCLSRSTLLTRLCKLENLKETLCQR